MKKRSTGGVDSALASAIVSSLAQSVGILCRISEISRFLRGLSYPLQRVATTCDLSDSEAARWSGWPSRSVGFCHLAFIGAHTSAYFRLRLPPAGCHAGAAGFEAK